MSLSFTDKTFPPTELEKLTGAGSVCSLMLDPASPNTAEANSTEPYSPPQLPSAEPTSLVYPSSSPSVKLHSSHLAFFTVLLFTAVPSFQVQVWPAESLLLDCLFPCHPAKPVCCHAWGMLARMSETHRPEEKSSVDRPRPASPAAAAPQFVHFCSALSVRGCPEPAELCTAVIISLLTLTRYYCCKLEPNFVASFSPIR